MIAPVFGQMIENPQLNATMGHMAHMVRTGDGEVLGAGCLDPLQMGFGPFERLYQTRDGLGLRGAPVVRPLLGRVKLAR